ncbi:hypothetical protein QQ045_013768 [Rhodiola kirilowii]
MSFLPGRLAGKEGAYFYQESKQAVGRLIEKKALGKLPTSSKSATSEETQADVLPEILRHSLPTKIFQQHPVDSTLYNYRVSNWNLPKVGDDGVSSISRDALNPLTANLSMPQVTFGPKRWEMPNAGNSASHSKANDLRLNKEAQLHPEKLKAVTEGFSLIGKAFAVATAIVFGGAALSIAWAVAKFEIRTSDDIRTKGKDIVQPKFNSIREQLTPLRNWVNSKVYSKPSTISYMLLSDIFLLVTWAVAIQAEDKNKRWNLQKESNIQEKPIFQELSKVLGAKPSS